MLNVDICQFTQRGHRERTVGRSGITVIYGGITVIYSGEMVSNGSLEASHILVFGWELF